MSRIISQVVGCGAALPRRCVTNEELAKTVDTDDAWIRSYFSVRRMVHENLDDGS